MPRDSPCPRRRPKGHHGRQPPRFLHGRFLHCRRSSQSQGGTPAAGSRTLTSSPSEWPRRSWASRATGASWPRRRSDLSTFSPPAWPGPATTGAAGARETIKWLLAHFAAQRPGVADVLLLTEPILWNCKDCSPWSATGRRPWPGCASACSRAFSASRPVSASISNWQGRSR